MRRSTWVCHAVVAATLVGCNESTTGNGPAEPVEGDIIVLNSLSRTIQQFNLIDGQLAQFEQPIGLPANFDGNALDFVQELFVTTTSAFGGSQIIFGSLSTGEQLITTFPGADPTLADAGRPTLAIDAAGNVIALVPARARDDAYIAFPGQSTAQLLAGGIGEFVERTLPFGEFILAVDANLDDDGGTFQPLGPPRVSLHRFVTGEFFDDVSIAGSTGATDALLLLDEIVVLSGGGLEPGTFQPEGDGTLVVINVNDRGIQDQLALGGNGLSLEAGRDGLGYIVRTKGAGTFETDVLTFNFSSLTFERGPANPIQPLDSDGSDLTCRVVSALQSGQLLCATFEAGAQGRLVLLTADGAYLHEATIGVGATDMALR